jgi:hypothetical protein
MPVINPDNIQFLNRHSRRRTMFTRKESRSVGNVPSGKLAKALGLASYGLGISQITQPGGVNRFIGVPDYNPNHALQRLLGVRELMSGTGILFGKNTRGWMWSRVAGDAMDTAILGSMFASGLGMRKRLVPAIAAVVALMVLDAKVALRTPPK